MATEMVADPATTGAVADAAVARISARIERLPMSAWHWRMLTIVGTADFFDAFDSLTISFVMPVLAKLWQVAPGQIGLLISSGFIGQAIGAIGLSWAAERYGRVTLLMWTLAIVAGFSILCAFAFDFQSLFWLRAAQGLAIGAEIPIASTYMNEIVMAKYRGRFAQGIQAIFGFGVLASSFIATFMVPSFGWQSMFILGALPAVLAAPLRRLLPESPRWLAQRRRAAEADAVMSRIERAVAKGAALPPPAENFPVAIQAETKFAMLFRGIYLKRTLTCWLLMFCTAYVGYGLITWIPSIFTTVYRLPVSEALHDAFIINLVGFCGTCSGLFFCDRLPRRMFFLTSFLGAGIPLVILGLVGTQASIGELMTLMGIARAFMTFTQTGVYFYVPEVYPTRMRALGTGTASAWMRVASFIGPLVIGAILASATINAVFIMFAAIAGIGVLIALFLLMEGRGRVLEELSP